MAKTSIQYIKEAAKKLIDSKLQRLGEAKTQEIFRGVMQTVGLESIEEVYLFVAQFDLTCRDRTSNMDDLSNYFECSSLDMIEYIPALKSLERKGLLVRRRGRKENIFKQYFAVSDTVMAAIIEDQSVQICQIKVDEMQIDKYEFCKRIAEKVEDNNVITEDLVMFVEKLENSNPHLPFISELKKDVADILDRTIFYDMCYDNLNHDGTGHSNVNCTLKDVFTNIPQRVMTKKSIVEEDYILMTLGLIEFDGDTDNIRLTDHGKDFYYGDDATLFIDNSISDKQLLACDKITEKKLFFSSELEEQLSLLRNSLDKDYYEGLCARLEENNLPKGIAVLLYGEPGTGKTESVMQIAKATGRAIIHVDISETKTCWFGESEKLIKKVFTDYRRLCEKSKVKPILLFNEADAVFSKRKDVNRGSVAQTENAIQNIILEEMENLDGILIATTNLADNLDGAFERRFLFKIRFDKPTVEAKRNIWISKLPSLSVEDAHTLASSYEFSGGQIDNIVRKALMQEVIKGEKPTLNSLVTMCSEEKISKKNAKRIGFC